MGSIKSVIESLPAGKVVAPMLGAAVPGIRDKIMSIGDTSEEDKKKMSEMQSQIDTLNKQRQPGATPMKKGGKVSSASKRADGCCVKGKTKGRMV